MPTPREEIGDRMLFAVDDFVEERKARTPQDKETEFWAALRQFLPEYIGGMTCMNIDAHGNVNMTFLKAQK